jgi:hypothetical protein
MWVRTSEPSRRLGPKVLAQFVLNEALVFLFGCVLLQPPPRPFEELHDSTTGGGSR